MFSDLYRRKREHEHLPLQLFDFRFAVVLHLPFPMLYFSRHDIECFPPAPFAPRSGLVYFHVPAQCIPLFRK